MCFVFITSYTSSIQRAKTRFFCKHLRQCCSSEPSSQSCSSSQAQRSGMHNPSLWHWNSFDWQEAWAITNQKGAQYAKHPPYHTISNAYFKTVHVNSSSIYLMANSKQSQNTGTLISIDHQIISAMASQQTDNPKQCISTEIKQTAQTYIYTKLWPQNSNKKMSYY